MAKAKQKDADIQIVSMDTEQVSCDGGDGALGHPIVYYTFDGGNEVVCGYCDKIFQRKKTTPKKKK